MDNDNHYRDGVVPASSSSHRGSREPRVGSDRGRRATSRSRSASPDRRRSPPRRRGRSRSYSPPHSGGGGRRAPRRSSRSVSRSRSRSPPSFRGRPDRDYRDHYDRPPPYRGDRYPGGPPPHRYMDDPPYRDDGWGGMHAPPPGRRGRDVGPPHPPFHRGGGPPPGPPHFGGPPPPPQYRHGNNDRGGGGGGGGGRRGERGGRGDPFGGEEGPPGVSLLVRNVGPEVTAADLQQAFGRIGVIRDVYVPRDYHSQQPRGFAFIEYANPEMAREAKIEMNRFRIKGHELEVVFAQERRKTPGEMKGRGSDGPNGGSDGASDRGGSGFERSSSFERHKERQRDGGKKSDREYERSSPGPGKDDR